MDGYARTDSLRFASGGTVRRGWQAALDGYEQGYPDRRTMGTLRFDSLDVQVLAPEWAAVFGRWRLQREEDSPDGLFTLLFHRRPDGWRIVHDHTSAAD
jgi:ketosteroid isomerase-like protein